MSQYSTQTGDFVNSNKHIFEIVYVANGANGNIVTTDNPLPVTLGSSNINIIGNISIPTTVSVNSSPDNPVHTHVTEFGNVNISGTSLPVTFEYSINTAPWEYQIARGKVSGVSQVNIFGYSSGVDGSWIPLWEANTALNYPTNPITMNVSSTSSLDNSSSQITINGLDSNFNPIVEVVTMNGTSNVVTSNSFYRINSVFLTKPATGQNTNIGTITVKNGVGTSHAQINPGIGKMQNGWYTVPANNSFYVTGINIFTGETKQGATPTWFYFRAITTNNISGITSTLLQTSFQNEYKVTRTQPFKYGEKTDIQWQFYSSDNGTHSISIILEGLLISNNL